MKKQSAYFAVAALAFFSLMLSGGQALATDSAATSTPTPELTSMAPSAVSINLHTTNLPWVIEWSPSITTFNSYKIIWSSSENPVYPIRGGDQFFNITNRLTHTYTFNYSLLGTGSYFVRICGILNGNCVYSNQITLQFGVQTHVPTSTPPIVPKGTSTPVACNQIYYPVCGNDGTTYINSCYASIHNAVIKYQGPCLANQEKTPTSTPSVLATTSDIAKIEHNAQELYQNKISDLLSQINAMRDTIKEQQVEINYLTKLTAGLAHPLTASTTAAITNFITYGVDANTQLLGQGQRAAVVYSFKQAYGNLPSTQAQLEDLIKIANGRWPSATSTAAEKLALAQFKKIYLRNADLSNPHDAAAIKIIAYGLQQLAKNRNLKSESAALKTFRTIFGRLPNGTVDWNTLGAITYSGSTR